MDKQQPTTPLAEAIEHALEQRELSLHYQPQFDPKTEDTASLEAFLRWQPVGRALQRAGQFISEIEGSRELAQRIDRWVMETALNQADEWLEQDYAFGTLSINLSSWDDSPTMPRALQQRLKHSRLGPRKLSLECSWRHLQQAPEAVIGAMRRFSDIGCPIVLNDHPLDDTCLELVRRSPVRLSKVGVDYLQEQLEQQGSKALSKRVTLWRKSGIEVAAIGVENEAQQQVCQQVGCRLTQGNRFKSPLPAQDMTQLLEMIKQTKIAFGLL